MKYQSKNQTLFGIFAILLSIYILLSHLKIIPKLPIWYISISAILGIIFIQNLLSKHWGEVILSSILLIISSNYIFQWIPIDTKILLLVTLLFYIGIHSLLPKRKKKIILDNMSSSYENNEHIYTFLSENTKYMNASAIHQSKIVTTLGTSRVYIQENPLAYDTSILYLQGTCCEISLFIPKQWQVSNEVGIFLGEDQIIGQSIEHTHHLILRGNVTMGELQIIFT